jgi:hypothetical protein
MATPGGYQPGNAGAQLRVNFQEGGLLASSRWNADIP